MAVVINEFEVVPGESEPARSSATSSAGDAESQAPPSPHEIERVIELHIQRSERVWAH